MTKRYCLYFTGDIFLYTNASVVKMRVLSFFDWDDKMKMEEMSA